MAANCKYITSSYDRILNRSNSFYVFLKIIVVLTLFSFARTSDTNQASRIVHTAFGTVRGRIVTLNIPKPGVVVEYLGIPYATPPLNKKRFMPPNSASKWSTTKDCSQFQKVCIQQFPHSFTAGETETLKWMPESYSKYLSRLRGFLEKESEDCLYLNLYVPERQGNQPMPVLMLIHGGSYSWGSGNPYNASILASYGRMIVVTLNYRLGIFGFLSAGYRAPLCRGNWALADIAAALEFLRQTISDFGGDPKLITLLGWDTGASLVNLLMSSPISAPAHARSFQRAILLGGSALSSWSTVANPTDAFFFVAESLGCVSKVGKRRNEMIPDASITDILNCLTSADAENITRIIREMESPTYLTIFGPSVDGSIVANDPEQNLREHGDLFRELDLMIGMTKHEAFHLLGNHELTHGVEREKRDEIYRTLVQNVFRYHRNEILAAITDEYTNWHSPVLQRYDIRDSILKALGDGLYVAPMINVARIHARAKRSYDGNEEFVYGTESLHSQSGTTSTSTSKHGSTFMYVFTHETKGLNRNRLLDSIHGEDLAYILGYPLLEQSQMQSGSLFNYSFDTNERILSEAMMRWVANFVRTGHPSRPSPIRIQSDDSGLSDALSQLIWPPFVADVREAYVEIGERPRDGLFYRAHEIAFWTKFLASLERAGQTASNEKHHHFPNRSTFYGVIRTLDRVIPFWKTTTPISTGMPSTIGGQVPITSISHSTSSTRMIDPLQERYSTILSVTVAVGCALLILNVLIFAGIYHQWDKQKRRRKQRYENHTQQSQSRMDFGPVLPSSTLNATNMNSTNAMPGHASLDRNRVSPYNAPNAGPTLGRGSRMPPAPPPPAPVSSLSSTMPLNGMDGDLHPTLSLRSQNSRDSLRRQHTIPLQMYPNSAQQAFIASETPTTPRGPYSEQEPLLNRTFISPTCPRHGKQALATATGSNVDEIQV